MTRWEDLTGSGIALLPSGDPRIGLEFTPSGAPSISFDGGDDGTDDKLEWLVSDTGTPDPDLPLGSEDRTVFVVVKYDDSNDFAGAAYGTGTSNQTFGLITSAGADPELTLQGWGGGNDFKSGEASVGAGWVVHSVVLSDDEFWQYKDGDLIDSGTHTFNTVLSKIVIAEETNGRDVVDMNIAAYLVYDRALTDSERLEVESYLNETYIEDGVNDPPSAAPDAANVEDGGAVLIDVLANDFDDRGLDPTTVVIVDQPANGTVNVNTTTGEILYSHDGSGEPDSFTYQVTDDEGLTSNVAQVTITIGSSSGGGDFSLEGFVNETVIGSGLSAPLALGFLPDNRMLVLEKDGEIFIADPESGATSLYLDISGIVNSGNERGLLDIAIPPDFDATTPGQNLIYLFYTRAADTNRAVIASFEHQEGAGGLTSTANAASEDILWTDTDGFTGCCHYGGGLDFGPDDKIWLTSSDKFNTTNNGEGPAGGDDVPLDLESTSGKIIRINRDGSIPDGTDGWPANPYVDGVIDGPYPSAGVTADPSIWAYGLRNPFRADWDAQYGKFYIGEVGGNQGVSTDDIHVASLDQAGAFYGWNFYEGINNTAVSNAGAVYDPADFPLPDTDLADPGNGDFYSAPIYDIPHSSLTGGFVYRGSMFPDEFDGVYFFGNYENNYIRFLDLDATGSIVEGVYDFKPSDEISGNTTNIVFLEEGIDGALYYVNYTANGGQVQRIVFEGDEAPTIENAVLIDNSGAPDDGAGEGPLTVTFTITVSDVDTPLTDLSYSLNFGDGTSAATGAPDPVTGEIVVEHTYEDDGFYAASLLVSDGIRSTLSQPLAITVGDPNDPPQIVSAGSDVGFGDPGLTVTFTATVDDPDTGDAPSSLIYVWDFGDGSPTVTGTPDSSGLISVTHTYGDAGVFNAFLTVSDSAGASVRSSDIPIQVGSASQLPVTDGLVFQVESFIKIGTSDGATVTEWLDESGSGNNLAALGDPQLVANATPTGQPAIVFDGAGDALVRIVDGTTALNGLPVGSGARTMFFVVDYEDVTNGEFAGLAYGNSSVNQAFGLTLNGNADDLTVQAWGPPDQITTVDGVIDPATGGQRGFISHAVMLRDDGSFSHYLNGVEIDTGSNTFNTVVERLLIGQNLNGGETPMSVAAAFIYDRALSVNEFDAVEAYVQNTYLVPQAFAPDAVADSYSATSATALTVPASTGLLANDIDSDPLTLIAIEGQPAASGDVFTLQNGTLTVGSDGSFSYTSVADFTGVETFTYTVSDGSETDTATVTITVNAPIGGALPVTDGLVAQLEADFNVIADANGVVSEWLDGSGALMDVVANGDPVLVEGATPSGKPAIRLDGGLAAFGEDGTAEGDSLSRSGDQSLPNLPTGNAPRTMYFVVDYKDPNGVFGGVSYGTGTPNDAFGLVLSNNGVLTLQGWGSGNDYPAPGEDGVGDNDGVGSDDWFIHSVRYDGATIRHYRDGTLIDTDDHVFTTAVEKFVIGGEIADLGFAALNVAAVLVYDRELDDTEHADTLGYLTTKYLAEPTGNSDPVAVDDSAATDAGTPVGVDVLANDSDGDEDALTIESVSDGTNGTVAIDDNGTADPDDDTVVYSPNAGFSGVDTFVYTVGDGNGGTDTATVTVTVTGAPSSGIPVTAGLALLLESDAGLITANGGMVSEWTDQSGRGNSVLVTGDADNDPTTGIDLTPSGAASVSFDGIGDKLVDGDPTRLATGSGDRTMFLVVDYVTSTTFAGAAYGTGAPNQAFGLVQNAANTNYTIQGWGGGNDQVSPVDGLDDGWVVQSAVLSNDTYEHFLATSTDVSDTLIDTGTHAFNTALGEIVLGAEIRGNDFSALNIASVVIFDRALSAAEHDLVEQYLADKYLAVAPPAPTVAITGPATITESDTVQAVPYTVTLSGPPSVATTVRVELSGATDDASIVGGVTATIIDLTFTPGGPLSQVVSVDVAGDDVAEADETITLALATSLDITPGQVGSVTTTIADDDIAGAELVLDEPGVMTFDGTNGGVEERAHSDVYEIPEGTVAFSFNAADISGDQGLFAKDASGFGGGGNHFVVYLDDDTLVARFQDGVQSAILEFQGIVPGREYEVAATFSPSGVELWVDGTRVGESALAMDWTQNVEAIQWGGRGWASASGAFGFDAPFEGTISDKQIYSAALTAAQIAALAATSSAINDDPIALDDAVTLDEDTSIDFDPTQNDSDPDGGTPMVTAVGFAAFGTAVLNADGTVNYTPDADYFGADSFEVEISDGQGGSATSTVSVNVTPVGDDPVAVDDTDAVVTGNPVVIDVTANDVDADGDTITVTAVTQGANGTVVNNGDGTVTYTPDDGFLGDDTFTYTIDDGNAGAPAVGSVTVSVLEQPNSDPVAVDDLVVVDEDGVLTFQPGDNDTDANGDTVLASAILSGPTNGTAVLNADIDVPPCFSSRGCWNPDQGEGAGYEAIEVQRGADHRRAAGE